MLSLEAVLSLFRARGMRGRSKPGVSPAIASPEEHRRRPLKQLRAMLSLSLPGKWVPLASLVDVTSNDNLGLPSLTQHPARRLTVDSLPGSIRREILHNDPTHTSERHEDLWLALLTIPFLTMFMVIAGDGSHVRLLASQVPQNPSLDVGLLVSGLLLVVQQWLVPWAPINGEGLSVSVGCFLLPLTLLVVGRDVYGERLTAWQRATTVLASLGVAHELYGAGRVS